MRLLLVEDEVELSSAISDWLQEDFEVISVCDGESALACLRNSAFDLVISDWMLPGISGLDLCRIYRAEDGAAAVLVMTAKKNSASKDQALAAGADDFLTKPFSLRDLSARIKTLLNKQSVA
jgi:DNA-binding response OmpR family regulator